MAKSPNDGGFSQYTGLAFLLPVSALVGWGMGYGLDKLFHTAFLQYVFLFLGIVAGMIEAVRESQQP
jgi:F0F1-type ATP synthase assembly protein I